MRNLVRRVEALEDQQGPIKMWHQLIVHPGETEADVCTAYEAEHGSIGEDGCIIWRVIECAA